MLALGCLLGSGGLGSRGSKALSRRACSRSTRGSSFGGDAGTVGEVEGGGDVTMDAAKAAGSVGVGAQMAGKAEEEEDEEAAVAWMGAEDAHFGVEKALVGVVARHGVPTPSESCSEGAQSPAERSIGAGGGGGAPPRNLEDEVEDEATVAAEEAEALAAPKPEPEQLLPGVVAVVGVSRADGSDPLLDEHVEGCPTQHVGVGVTLFFGLLARAVDEEGADVAGLSAAPSAGKA